MTIAQKYSEVQPSKYVFVSISRQIKARTITELFETWK